MTISIQASPDTHTPAPTLDTGAGGATVGGSSQIDLRNVGTYAGTELASLSRHGGPVMDNGQDGDLFMYGRMQMSVRAGLRAGVLVRDAASGRLLPAENGRPIHSQGTPSQESHEGQDSESEELPKEASIHDFETGPLHPEADAVLTELHGQIEAAGITPDAFAASVLADHNSHTVQEGLMKIAHAQGIEVGALRSKIAMALGAVENRMRNELVAHGVADFDDFVEYMTAQDGGTRLRAIGIAVLNGSASSLKGAAKAYREARPGKVTLNPHIKRGETPEIHKTADGKEYILINQGGADVAVSVANAKRLGFI